VSRPAWLRLADFLAEKKRWKDAAQWYNQAWENDRKQAVPLYLRGWCLTRLGRDKEGQLLIDRAHWLPLGNDLARFQLAEALDKHGLTEAADRERDFILRTGAFQSVAVTNVQNRIEAQALAHKDFLQAAGCCDRVMLAVLQTGAAFVKTRSYLFVPFTAHRHRARAFLASGKIEEAKREIQLCLADLPSDTDLPILLLPELEKAGQKKDADELFSRVFDMHVKLCTEYPRCGWGHNALAWVAARCRRQLDQALEHANKAVEISPDNAGFLDTLAEVHFQRGEKDQAIPLMKKCVELEPRTEYFRKQLTRFEAGDPKTEVPEDR
jgi:tetratricopeptide (TPR) repeat protein